MLGYSKKFLQFILIYTLAAIWIFSGWPPIWHNPAFPPRVELAHAAILCERPSSFTDHTGGNTTWDANGQSYDTSTCPGHDSTTQEGYSEYNINGDDFGHWNWSASSNTYSDLSAKIRITTSGYSVNTWSIYYTVNGNEPDSANGTLLDRETTESGTCPAISSGSTNGTCVYSVSLSAGQDFTSLKIGVVSAKGAKGGDAGADIQIFDVWTEGTEQSVSAPSVTTSAASSITNSSATLNGDVTNNGGEDASTCGFAWGTNSALSGGDTATTTDSTCPSGTGVFSKGLTGLSDNTTYYFRAYGTNSGGTGYGNITNFTTDALTYSVTITSSGTVEYGFVELSTASSTVGNGYTQMAENDGNTTEMLNVKSSDATGGIPWTLASSIGNDTYKHEFSTTTGATWDIMPDDTTYVVADSSVAQGGTVDFDFRLTTPSSSSDYTQKSITITIQAVAP